MTSNCFEEGNIIQITSIDGFRDWISYTTVKGKGPHLGGFDRNSFFASMLKLIKEKSETIVIYRKENEVIALDKRTGKKAIARCCPEDTFNFETGAKLAFERLMNEEKPKVPLNTKICITSIDDLSVFSNDYLTVGKIYEIKDGNFKNDDGGIFPLNHTLYSIDDLIDYLRADDNDGGCKYSLSHIHFVEVLE